jgi:hypothetical protein
MENIQIDDAEERLTCKCGNTAWVIAPDNIQCTICDRKLPHAILIMERLSAKLAVKHINKAIRQF